jgi:hypothetical protein
MKQLETISSDEAIATMQAMIQLRSTLVKIIANDSNNHKLTSNITISG